MAAGEEGELGRGERAARGEEEEVRGEREGRRGLKTRRRSEERQAGGWREEGGSGGWRRSGHEAASEVAERLCRKGEVG
ncbi:Hypothetical protein CAP_6667 [Chondromyces apiculatus DSM 436]|uniref:Uncharacterized protein n=1 Tax=Chondromyces apiculatus DSM 436 TaxID=1192034 RepID=A0A017T0Y3_9BACT|nr:Hypothetical protein CAP_6667 [Chondromyces apiculatus DSM 436]